MTTSSGRYVGVDVAKDRLDVAVLGEKQEKQVDNTPEGIASLVQWMQAVNPVHIPVKSHSKSGACRTARGGKSAVVGIVS